jgi:ankyrin repeat protein
LDACPQACGKLFAGGRTLLHEIVPRKASIDVIDTYLTIYKAGAMIADSSGELPLHWAAQSGSSLAIVKRLIQEYPESVRLANQDGKLPLHMAIHSRNIETVEYLLTLYPEACQQTDSLGWLPLHYAVNSSPEPVPAILDMCLTAFPGGCEHPNYQGFFPLHLYIRNRASPALWVIDKLIAAFPFAAFVTTGEQDELPLHVLAARCPPSTDCIQALVTINPDSVFQKSKETAWADADTPLNIAVASARKRDGGENEARGVVGPLEDYWRAVRVMLSTRPKHDADLLRESNYKVRRGVLMLSVGLYARKYPKLPTLYSMASSHEENADETKQLEKGNHEYVYQKASKGMEDVFDVLAELLGTSPLAFRKVIQFL